MSFFVSVLTFQYPLRVSSPQERRESISRTEKLGLVKKQSPPAQQLCLPMEPAFCELDSSRSQRPIPFIPLCGHPRSTQHAQQESYARSRRQCIRRWELNDRGA
jgi:hypothetical protein